MLFYNYETMRYERVGDKRPDLLAEKLDMDYGSDEPAENDDDDLY